MNPASPGRAGHPRRLAGIVAIVGSGLLLAAYLRVLLIRWGQPQTMQDFASFWIAGRLAATGKAAMAYDWVALNRQLYEALGDPGSHWVRTFYYPPMILLVLAPLGLLPFAAAAAVWLAANLATYLAGLYAVLRDAGLLIVALAAPTVLLNLSAGQNGLLTAGLLAAALAIIDKRPIGSGILIGLLAYKPQFGLLLPPFLAVTGRWRVFASASLTVLLLVLAAAACFGWSVFLAFAGALPAAVDGYLEHQHMTRALPWDELQSTYGTLRAIGFGNAVAWCGHAAVGLAAVAATLRLAAGGARWELQAAMLTTASVLVTPYSEDDDVALLMAAWAFLLRDSAARRLHPWEIAALAAVLLLPLVYLLGRAFVRVHGSPQLTSWVGMGPITCALLVTVIGSRICRRELQ